jgi:hypothetical protein
LSSTIVDDTGSATGYAAPDVLERLTRRVVRDHDGNQPQPARVDEPTDLSEPGRLRQAGGQGPSGRSRRRSPAD